MSWLAGTGLGGSHEGCCVRWPCCPLVWRLANRLGGGRMPVGTPRCASISQPNGLWFLVPGSVVCVAVVTLGSEGESRMCLRPCGRLATCWRCRAGAMLLLLRLPLSPTKPLCTELLGDTLRDGQPRQSV